MKISSKRVSMSVRLIFLTFAHIKRKETIFQRKAIKLMQFGKVSMHTAVLPFIIHGIAISPRETMKSEIWKRH